MNFLRGLLSFFILSVAGLLIGGLFMRDYVVRLLRSNALTSSSVLFTRPFPIANGTDIHGSHLFERLSRLGYQRKDGLERAGEYSFSPGTIRVFLRAFDTAAASQNEAPLEMAVFDGRIQNIIDIRSSRRVDSFWLEPEPLSLLGNSSTRAVSPKTLEQFPKILKDAVLGIEDERFYMHFGIDPVAVGRALAVNLESGRIAQGGSTLTQQLAKNLFFSSERSLSRKALEAVSAVLIETAFSKDQIFEFYLNEVFLGQEGSVAIHGFGEAARSFFGKEVEDLTLAESATLAGVIKAPTRYSPRRNPDDAKERRDVVVERLRALGVVSDQQAEAAKRTPLKTVPAYRSRRAAPYFVDYVRRVVEAEVALPDNEKDAVHIFTGIDREYQTCGEEAVTKGLAKLESRFAKLRKNRNNLQSALVAVVPSSGQILAWVGGRDYSKNQFDRVSLAKRQPGSAFKPFVYLTALDKDLNSYRVARTSSTLLDEPITYQVPGGIWAPENYDKQFRGEVTVRQALVHSLNVPTVNLASKVGVSHVLHTASLFGFGDNLPAVPSVALGAGEVTPLEMAGAYAALANGGVMAKLRPVSEVTVNGDPLIIFARTSEEKRVASEPAVYVLTNILQTALESGTGRPVRDLGFAGPAAGKTGTSNDTRDAWFAGYTPRLLAVVWVGFDDNKQLGLTGGQAAAPIWADFMKCVQPMEPELEFIPPPGVVFRKIDITSGLLATGDCSSSDVVTEVYVSGTEPVTRCEHVGFWGGDRGYLPENRPGRSPSLWERIFGRR